MLFVCALTIYLTGHPFTDDVVPVLIAVAVSCLLSYSNRAGICALLTAAFAAYALAVPWACIFLPLLVYDSLYSPEQWIVLGALPPFAASVAQIGYSTTVAVAVLFLVAAVLRRRSAAFDKLRREHFRLRDSMREMTLRLQRQNQDLLARQDSELTMATLKERNRIAREIHDNVGHLLSRALLQTGALLAVTKNDNRAPLTELKATLSEAMDSIRKNVHNLHDESINLHAGIARLIDKFRFCPVDFDDTVRRPPNSQIANAVMPIVKEALSNIIRHSDATQAAITLREHPAFYQLIIADNGHVRRPPRTGGIGLKNMHDRIEALGGVMTIRTEHGFELFITIPKGEK
mgnify:CR=1 FL=1